MSDGDVKAVRSKKWKRGKMVKERGKEMRKYHETVWGNRPAGRRKLEYKKIKSMKVIG